MINDLTGNQSSDFPFVGEPQSSLGSGEISRYFRRHFRFREIRAAAG